MHALGDVPEPRALDERRPARVRRVRHVDDPNSAGLAVGTPVAEVGEPPAVLGLERRDVGDVPLVCGQLDRAQQLDVLRRPRQVTGAGPVLLVTVEVVLGRPVIRSDRRAVRDLAVGFGPVDGVGRRGADDERKTGDHAEQRSAHGASPLMCARRPPIAGQSDVASAVRHIIVDPFRGLSRTDCPVIVNPVSGRVKTFVTTRRSNPNPSLIPGRMGRVASPDGCLDGPPATPVSRCGPCSSQLPAGRWRRSATKGIRSAASGVTAQNGQRPSRSRRWWRVTAPDPNKPDNATAASTARGANIAARNRRLG